MSNKQYSKSNRKINGVQQSSEFSFSEVYILSLFPYNSMSFTHEEEIKVAKQLLILCTLPFEPLTLKYIGPEPNYQKCK